jgi:acyl-ACP thioesterase
MSTTPPILSEQRTIGWFDVDVRRRLRPQALFAYLLDAASKHAEGTVFGYEELAARNLKWVMVKLQLILWQQPKWGETVTVETWGKRIDRLYALRDFRVTDGDGRKLVSGTSAWLIIDRKRGLPQRWDARAEMVPWQTTLDELETSYEKPPELRAGRPVGRYQVHYSDIDVNRHANASRYLQWIVDSHSQEQLESSGLAAFELSFLAEALPNDEVTVLAEERDGRELCSVRRDADGKELCRASLLWRASE